MKKFRFTLITILFMLTMCSAVFGADIGAIRNKTGRFLIDESNSAMRSIESFRMNGVIDMLMGIGIGTDVQPQSMNMLIDGLVELPGRIYIKYGIDTDFGIFESYEIYIREDGIYTRIPGTTDGWEYAQEFEGMYEMLTEIVTNSAAFTEGITQNYPEFAELEEKIYSKVQYSRNAVIEGNEYYVVTMYINFADLMDSLDRYMTDVFVAQEDYMHEGYAQEALESYRFMLEQMTANMAIEMFISKHDLTMGYMSASLDMEIDLQEMLGGKIGVLADYVIRYSEFNQDLPFPEL